MTPIRRSLTVVDHARSLHDNRYVYAVLSRRAQGVSIGVNLNPDKRCNFDCLYCQVDRRSPGGDRSVDTDLLAVELRRVLELFQAGAAWQIDPFASVPADRRRLNDIAFSGDGEPTEFKNFHACVQIAADLKAELNLAEVKIVVISNTSFFHRADVQQAFALMDKNNGEIWAKLDAGTPEYFARIDNTRFPFQKVLDNILLTARLRPIVIQACFMRYQGSGPPPAEIDAWIGRINALKAAGAQFKGVQVYTVARPPMDAGVHALADAEVDAIAARVRRECGLEAWSFYGTI
ncbi:MAG: radical SAM protein [Planctomycetota bacterium]